MICPGPLWHRLCWGSDAHLPPDLKILAIAQNPGGPTSPTRWRRCGDRTYPLYDEITMYVHQAKDKSIDPKVREFRDHRDRKDRKQYSATEYLPLTALSHGAVAQTRGNRTGGRGIEMSFQRKDWRSHYCGRSAFLAR